MTVARYYTPYGRSTHRDEKKKTGGIAPDFEIAVSRETEVKLQAQSEFVYDKGKEESVVEEKNRVADEVLNRALELLKAREVLSSLNVVDG